MQRHPERLIAREGGGVVQLHAPDVEVQEIAMRLTTFFREDIASATALVELVDPGQALENYLE